MTEINLTLAIILSLSYTIVLNLSKGIQKYGIEGLSLDTLKKWRSHPELKSKFLSWLIGSAGTVVAAALLLAAQPYVPNSSFPVAFSGIGLMSLVIFSYFILNEGIKAIEIIGTVIILIATLFFGINSGTKTAYEVNYGIFIAMGSISLGAMLLIGLWSIRHNYRGHAVIWGTMAGLCAGIGVASAQTAAISGNREFLTMIAQPDIWIALVMGNGAFWFTQYGFKHGHATIVVTLYNALTLIVPVIIDIFVLHHDFPATQLVMLFFIGAGVVMLSAFREEKS
jgi:multidrug transporter EmrE-like cation transporter